MKRSLFFVIFVFFLLSCRYDRVYHNRKFRYKIKYPQNWIAINSAHDKKAEEEFKALLKENTVHLNNKFGKNYEFVDAAFYNSQSKPPLFEYITIKGEQRRFNVNNLQGNMAALEDQLILELFQTFGNVKKIKSGLENLHSGQVVRFEMTFHYQKVDYFVIFVIIPGRLFATYFVNGLCPVSNQEEFLINFEKTLKSFKKY